MDQLKELGREEREETLIDLFLDSIIDPKFEVTVANCRLKDQVTLFECFEAMRKYDNIITRDSLANERNNLTSRRINGPTNKEIDKKSKKIMVLTLIIDLTRNGRNCQLNRGKPFSRRENNAITRKKQMIHHLNPSMPLESNQHILTFKITPFKQYVLHSRMKIRTPDGV